MPDKKSFDFDVFISFSSQDDAWVRGELMPRIERAGVTVFVYGSDFTPGSPSVNEMTRGVVKCRKTLAVLTPDYVQSEWCEIEHIMAAALGPANRDLRLIPLLKVDCEKPLHIAALTHIDFTDGEDRPPRLKNESDQAWTLAALANSYSLSGQPRRAAV